MTKLEQMCESNTSHYRSNKLELVARQVVANGVQGTYAKYYSVPPAEFEALREALAEQAEQESVRLQCTTCGTVYAEGVPPKLAEQEPVARVTGYHGGRCVVEPLNRALVLPTDMALYAEPVQQVTRADLKAAFKEGFERAADLYAPNDGQEPYAYEVWDVQDQSFTMIYATQLKEFHWIEPENIARVLYTAPQPVQEPVAWMDLHKELGKLRWMGGDEGWDNAINAVRDRLIELATPRNSYEKTN